jgi:allantoin racemase
MKIALINPNSTRPMTEMMADAAVRVASNDTEIVRLTAAAGPAAIESYADEALAAAEVVKMVHDHQSLDGYIIGCASDPGLLAARELTTAPVTGIGEAAFLFAITLAPRFSVLTTLDRAVEQVRSQLRGYGLHGRCCSVRACGVGVLDTAAPASDQFQALANAGRAAVVADGAEAIVLGCGGMSHLTHQLSADIGVPVVDGVRAAVALVEGLVRCGLTTSKHRTLAPPDVIPGNIMARDRLAQAACGGHQAGTLQHRGSPGQKLQRANEGG